MHWRVENKYLLNQIWCVVKGKTNMRPCIQRHSILWEEPNIYSFTIFRTVFFNIIQAKVQHLKSGMYIEVHTHIEFRMIHSFICKGKSLAVTLCVFRWCQTELTCLTKAVEDSMWPNAETVMRFAKNCPRVDLWITLDSLSHLHVHNHSPLHSTIGLSWWRGLQVFLSVVLCNMNLSI